MNPSLPKFTASFGCAAPAGRSIRVGATPPTSMSPRSSAFQFEGEKKCAGSLLKERSSGNFMIASPPLQSLAPEVLPVVKKTAPSAEATPPGAQEPPSAASVFQERTPLGSVEARGTPTTQPL